MEEYSIRRVLSSAFFKNVAALTSGATVAQILPVLISPILSRIYTPDEFGSMALFMAICGYISIIVTGQYESAIMLPKADSDALSLVMISVILTTIISLSSFLFIFIGKSFFQDLLLNANLDLWFYFIPISIFFSGMYQTLSNWCSRKQYYKRLAFRQISQSVSSSLVKIIIGTFKLFTGGLIAGTLFGQLTAASVMIYQFVVEDAKDMLKVSTRQVITNMRVYSDFPKYNAAQSFLDIFRQNGIILIITSFFGLKVLGLFSFSLSMITYPSRLISTSVGQVFYQRASKAFNLNEDVWNITRKTLLLLVMLGFMPFIVILLFGPGIFRMVFGDYWIEAGFYCQILSIWTYLSFVISPLSTIPLIYNRQKEFLLFSLINNLLTPLVFLSVAYFVREIVTALVVLSVTNSFYLIIMILYIKKLIKLNATKNDGSSTLSL